MAQRSFDRRAMGAWLLVVLWGAFIWGLGGDEFSMSTTSRFLGPLLRWLFPGLEGGGLQAALVGIRKLAHVAEFGVLALLSFRAVRISITPRRAAGALGALGIAAALAVADEARQGASALRTGSALDVVLDLVGAGLALGLLFGVQASGFVQGSAAAASSAPAARCESSES